jgi:protein-L-isoaspartate(D-aspartate) O-methyltransferase
MTEILLECGTPDVVLEVGTGSGYQSAILSRLVPKVYTVERISALLQKARDAHRKMGLMNVFSKHSDGSWGWAPNAPYQAIMVTAAPKTVPPGLLEQLAVGGRMIIPVGSTAGTQELKLYTRTAEGVEETTLELVNFVPLLDGAVRQ